LKKNRNRLQFHALIRTFVSEMDNTRLINWILVLVAIVLAALCVMSVG
jgi:hypothetical protein